MIESPEDRRAPLTPQLAVRVAAVGSFALAMFAIIFFRLWFLQVLTGQAYAKQANTNQTRQIEVAAARGQMLDRNGKILVDSTQTSAVEVSPQQMPVPLQTLGQYLRPPPRDLAVYRRLDSVLGMSRKPARCHVDLKTSTLRELGFSHDPRLAPIPCMVAQQLALLPYGYVTVKTGVAPAVRDYLAERQNQFPGVLGQQAYLRSYPDGQLAAQPFGTVGRISCSDPRTPSTCETRQPHFRGVDPNQVVGQSGLEYSYDRFLRGTPGRETVQVNALGQSTGFTRTTKPKAGYNLKLSLDSGVQRAGEASLAQSIASNPPSDGGAFVALNPENGDVYGMGSLPTFNPGVFTKPIPKTQYDQMFGPQAGSPQLNRATQSAGPTGSTFKMITATAALQSGAWSVGASYDDTGQFCQATLCRSNAGGAAYGSVDIVSAIKFSSDVFFYNLGSLMNGDPATYPNGGALQQWARRFGIGRPTGIDLPGEATGNLPTPRWRAQINRVELACERGHHVPPSGYFSPSAGCGIADGRPWSQGDNVNLAVGQGDVQVTPLQLAVAYSTLANGGTVVTPHVGMDVLNADGTVLQRIQPAPRRQLHLDPTYRSTIMQGLRDAASVPGGTSADVFGSFPEQVYGKTGTAQYIANGVEHDYSWYACFVPASATSKPIAVVVTVQKGGYGAVAAAPVAREILSQWFFGKAGNYVAGNSRTR